MSRNIVIYGAGGFAREVLQIINDINEFNGADMWNPCGYIVDEAYLSPELINGLPILGTIDWLRDKQGFSVVVAVGSSYIRRRVCEQVYAFAGNCFATLIHPRAWVGAHNKIGSGSIICAGALITTNVSIGQHVHVNIGSTVGHDAALENYVTLNPSVNISGNVKVEPGCEIGTGSVLIPHVNIGEWTIVGAGSVVTKSLPANSTAVGAPAKVIKQREPGWHLNLLGK